MIGLPGIAWVTSAVGCCSYILGAPSSRLCDLSDLDMMNRQHLTTTSVQTHYSAAISLVQGLHNECMDQH